MIMTYLLLINYKIISIKYDMYNTHSNIIIP